MREVDRSKILLGVLATAIFVLFPLIATAADFAPDPVDMPAAKREGGVSWYTSTPIEAAQTIAKLFEQASGIKVQLFRSGGSAVMSRFMQERQARRVAADLLTTSDPAASAVLAREGAFVPFKPRNFDKVPDTAKDRDGFYVAQRLNMLGIFVRGDKVAADQRPKTWSDLTDARYKGQLVMPDPSFTSLQLIAVGTLSRKLGWGFYEKLRANDIMIVQGHEQVEDMLKRGERLVAAEGLDSYAVDDRKAGHDIVTIYPSEGAFAIASPTAIVKGSPSPNAAKALAEFMLSDAVQQMFPAAGFYGARIDLPPPAGSPALADLALLPVDYADIEKRTGDIKSRFNEIFQ
ncbi:MAG: extracellular solute-binding protein family 1 [Rhodospirillales bacterium]|nr:extracellular solute-binding protein family 1 [Rhodospirillales bacterium]